jgi:hypothetical protein
MRCPEGSIAPAYRQTGEQLCTQVCLWPELVRSFLDEGGLIGGSCRRAGCAQLVGTRWVRGRTLVFDYRCASAPEPEGEAHAEASEPADAAGSTGRATSDRELLPVDTTELATLILAAVSLAASTIALCCLRRILVARPHLAQSPFPAVVEGRGGILRRNDSLHGLRVQQILSPPPGLPAGKVVVTQSGDVWFWDGTTRLAPAPPPKPAGAVGSAKRPQKLSRKSKSKGKGAQQPPSRSSTHAEDDTSTLRSFALEDAPQMPPQHPRAAVALSALRDDEALLGPSALPSDYYAGPSELRFQDYRDGRHSLDGPAGYCGGDPHLGCEQGVQRGYDSRYGDDGSDVELSRFDPAAPR